jgi:hypothetical protein
MVVYLLKEFVFSFKSNEYDYITIPVGSLEAYTVCVWVILNDTACARILHFRDSGGLKPCHYAESL